MTFCGNFVRRIILRNEDKWTHFTKKRANKMTFGIFAIGCRCLSFKRTRVSWMNNRSESIVMGARLYHKLARPLTETRRLKEA